MKISALTEIVGLLIVLLTASLFGYLGLVPLSVDIWLTTLFLCLLLYLSWSRFDGGLHPCFLFLGTLLVFQGGRFIGYIFGIVDDPMQIDVGALIPITVSPHTAHLTLFLLCISALCIYTPCRLAFRENHIFAEPRQEWLRLIYAVMLLTIPAALYKNLAYLMYIRAHGGYLAVYTDNAAVLQSAGFLARTFSMLNATAILAAFVLESKPRRLKQIALLFFVLSTLELLIGFRGKFFTQAVSMWFIYNLKRHRSFKLLQLGLVAVAVSVLAVVISAFRENSAVQLLNPVGMISVQGISLNVTEAAVEFQKLFASHGARYVWNGFITAFTPVSGEGKLWSGDLSFYLNPVASNLGFGTASTYLAELFLLAGTPAVIVGSLAIGWTLSFLYRRIDQLWGALALAFVLPALIYLPRLELLNPLGVLIKSAISLSMVAGLVVCFQILKAFLQAHLIWKVQVAHDE